MSRVLIVVAHRDDETLGAGGAISWHREKGDKVQVISMTDGVSARKVGGSLEEKSSRTISSLRVAEFLDFSWRDSGSFPDNAMDTVPIPEVIRFIEKAKSEFKPEIVYTHFPFDLNIDHILTAKAVFTAFRPEPGEACRELLSFEVPSSTDFGSFLGTEPFRPNFFVNLDRLLQKKLDALAMYGSEIREAPHVRSLDAIRTLAMLRGSQIGIHAAEAFQVHRKVAN
jgi:LmbE family N-acetylglucosaminyl deacetylase